MLVTKPLGARVIVKEIITTLSLEERGRKANLTIVTAEENRPRPTQGKVVALGTDPFLRDNGLKEGCIVFFAPLSGIRIYLEGEEFRSLELQEIIAVQEGTTNEADTNEQRARVPFEVPSVGPGPAQPEDPGALKRGPGDH